MLLPQFLAEVPNHNWCEKTQAFIAEIKANGVVCRRYVIPRHVFFAIHADMARAILECAEAEQGAEVVAFKQADSG